MPSRQFHHYDALEGLGQALSGKNGWLLSDHRDRSGRKAEGSRIDQIVTALSDRNIGAGLAKHQIIVGHQAKRSMSRLLEKGSQHEKVQEHEPIRFVYPF